MDRTINVILKPLRRFAMQKPNASILLFMAMILAMLFANSPWADPTITSYLIRLI